MKRKYFYAPLIAFVLVMLIPFSDVFAYTYNPVGGNYVSLYGSEVFDFITLDEDHIRLYSENHFDNVPLGSYFGNSDKLADFEDAYGFNLLSSMPCLTIGYDYGTGQELDFSGYQNTLIYTPYANTNSNSFGILRFSGDNLCCLSTSNGFYICSSSPFEIGFGEYAYSNDQWVTSYVWQGYGTAPRLIEVNSLNSDFLADSVYAYDIMHIMTYNSYPFLQFVNVPVYSSYQTDADISLNTFSFADTSSYFDMNVNTRNGIFTPEEEEEEEDYVSLGEYYNYVGMTGYFEPCDTYSLYNHLNFSYNSYMRLHPNEFTLSLRYEVEVIPQDTNDYGASGLPFNFTQYKDIPLQDIFGSNNNLDASRYTDKIYFVDLDADSTLSGVENFNEFMVAWYSYRTGLNSEWFDDGFFTNEGKYYKIKNNMNVKEIRVRCRAKMVYSYDSQETSSGYLIYHYDMLSGKNTVDGNAAAVNNNPLPDPPSQYGNGEINTSGGSSVNNNYSGGSYSGGNVTINGLGNQPVYTLNETQLQGIAEMINYITGTLENSQENNGFWQVLKGCFDYIPERIWTWIIVTIGAVCSGAVARWYLTSKR